MSKFEILCVTMHQKDFSKIEEMNIHSNVVFANQGDHTSYDEYSFDGHTAKMISTQTRGVGINRNLTLMYASADICIFADDDVVYADDMEQRVVAEFDAHPDADVIIFHLDAGETRKQISYSKTKKCTGLFRMPWGALRIAFRRNAVQKANIWFTTLFGGGCLFPCGEDSMWLIEAKRKGLCFYVSKESIGKIDVSESSWYTGRDEKYFFSRGALYAAVHPKTQWLWNWYAALSVRKNCNLSIVNKKRWLNHGRKAYREFQSYKDYCRKHNI